MTEHGQLDQLVLGRRVRHFRNQAGLTLDGLGAKVGKPAPYLSLLENGKKQPKLALMVEIASALEVPISDLLESSAPSRRDQLEIALIRAQQSALFDSLDVPTIKPSAKVDSQILAHVVGLHDALRDRASLGAASSEEVRRANGAVQMLLTSRDGYLEEVEDAAKTALDASGHEDDGPFTSRNLIDLSANVGFELSPIEDMPSFARSIIDSQNKRIYIAQRNELRTRQARKAVLQTLAGFLLRHEQDPDLETFLRQRMETAYFAGAVLAPEDSVVSRLQTAKENHDIDVEDVKELFYISYQMAAWRTVNLLTHHFGIRSHLLVSDEMGTIGKGYGNDGAPIPRDEHGGMETQKLCRRWGARQTFTSEDTFDTHHQYTDTPAGTFFCSTHVETGGSPANAVTVGVRFADAKWFRGRDTENRQQSQCPDPACCRLPEPELAGRWSDKVVVSARSQDRILGMLAPDPYPELDMPEILAVVDAHAG